MSLAYIKSDGVGRKIIPAPIVTINKTYTRNDDESKLGTKYSITLQGTLVAHRGSPSGSYTSLDNAFWSLSNNPPDEILANEDQKFNSILRKQEALRWLFNEDGGSLEWQPNDGSPVVKCNPKIISINFTEGKWVDRSDYSIELEAPWIFINGTTDIEDNISQQLITSSSENWSFEQTEGRNGQSYTVRHEVTAVGKTAYDENGDLFENKESWEHAKDFVDALINGSVDPNIMLAAINVNNWLGGEYVKNTNTNKKSGTYSIVETWLLMPTTTFIEKSFDISNNIRDDEITVRYEGNIKGISNGERGGGPVALQNAINAVPTNNAARTEANNNIGAFLEGQALPINPESKSVVTNQIDGTVGFTFEWATGETEEYTRSFEATTSFNENNGLYSISLTENIEGHGDTTSEKITNLKNGVLSDSLAFVKALNILGASLSPPNSEIINRLRNKTSSINEKQATGNFNWTWDNSTDNSGIEITTDEQKPSNVMAVLQIPGRQQGPVIQDMGTKTASFITVTVRGRNQSVKPNGEVLALPFSKNGTKVSDQERFNQQTGFYERTIRYIITEQLIS